MVLKNGDTCPVLHFQPHRGCGAVSSKNDRKSAPRILPGLKSFPTQHSYGENSLRAKALQPVSSVTAFQDKLPSFRVESQSDRISPGFRQEMTPAECFLGGFPPILPSESLGDISPIR